MDSVKYNRTFHLPWSKGATNDDKISTNIFKLIGVPIIITEKMDGSNTSLEKEGCFARTHSGSPSHPSFDGLKSLHASLSWKIPNGIQLFGEWCFAVHSIKYEKLPNYFLLFNVRDLVTMKWLSWDEVQLWAEEIGVFTVPVLFAGIVSSEKELKEIIELLMIEPSIYGDIREGVVVRVQDSFDDKDFSSNVMKFVRANHVQTTEHWKNQAIVKNQLSK